METVKQNPDKEYFQLVKGFPLVAIKDSQHFDEAIKIMKELCYRGENISAGAAEYLSVLGDLIVAYEKNQSYSIDAPVSPQRALLHLMKENGLAQSDLVPYVGQQSNLSAFLAGKRDLSKEAIVRLAERFQVSPSLFLPRIDEIGKTCGLCRRLRLYLEYHDGYSVEGQWSCRATNYLSVKMQYGF